MIDLPYIMITGTFILAIWIGNKLFKGVRGAMVMKMPEPTESTPIDYPYENVLSNYQDIIDSITICPDEWNLKMMRARIDIFKSIYKDSEILIRDLQERYCAKETELKSTC